MKERNPMPIRKFTLIGLIALGLIILSIVGELFTFKSDLYTSIQTYVVLISQFIGNVLFGIALIGYFMHLKENKMLNEQNRILKQYADKSAASLVDYPFEGFREFGASVIRHMFKLRVESFIYKIIE